MEGASRACGKGRVREVADGLFFFSAVGRKYEPFKAPDKTGCSLSRCRGWGEGAGSGASEVRRRCGPRPRTGARVAASACLRRGGGVREGEVGSQAESSKAAFDG